MNTQDKHNSDVATCRACLLADTMKPCKNGCHCRFEVGLNEPRCKICGDTGRGVPTLQEPDGATDGCVCMVADTTPKPDTRITRRESILAAFQDEPLTMDEAMELYNELAEIDQALQFHPSDTCQAYVSAAWGNMQEVKF